MSIIYTKKYKPKKRSKKVADEVYKPFKSDFKPLSKIKANIGARPGSDHSGIKSKTIRKVSTTTIKEQYDGEMAEREAIAQEKIEQKKKMVAPLYSKGGYQYIGDVDNEIIKDLGKKK